MALQDASKINISLKKIAGKAHTNNSKDPSNEAESSFIITLADNVWVDAISSDSTTAVGAGIAEEVECDLTEDVTSNGKAYFLKYPAGHGSAGQQVTGCIPVLVSNDYEPVLWRNKGTSSRIYLGDTADWVFDPAAGVVTSEDDLNLDANSKCDIFIYTGNKLSTAGAVGKSFAVDEFTLDSNQITTTKQVTLTNTPAVDADVKLTVYGGIAQDEGIDYSVSGTTLTWNSYALDGILEVGDKIEVSYSYAG